MTFLILLHSQWNQTLNCIFLFVLVHIVSQRPVQTAGMKFRSLKLDHLVREGLNDINFARKVDKNDTISQHSIHWVSTLFKANDEVLCLFLVLGGGVMN